MQRLTRCCITQHSLRRTFNTSNHLLVPLIDLPNSEELQQKHISSKPVKFKRKTQSLTELQQNARHIIGYEDYSINVSCGLVSTAKDEEGILPKAPDLNTLLEKIFQKLNITRETKFFKGEDFIKENKITLPKFQNPYKDELAKLEDILPIERFKFDINDFEITQELLDQQPITIPSFTKSIINNETKDAESALGVMGINKDIFLAVRPGVNPYNRLHYDCEFFTLRFYHHTHFLSRIRKSRPAIFFLNKNESRVVPNKILDHDLKFSDLQRPMKFAVNRSQTKKLLKSIFFDEYSSRDNKRDGLYQITMKYPPRREEREEIKKHMTKALDKVERLNEDMLIQESKQQESQIRWNEVQRIQKVVNGTLLNPIYSKDRTSSVNRKPKSKTKAKANTKSNKQL